MVHGVSRKNCLPKRMNSFNQLIISRDKDISLLGNSIAQTKGLLRFYGLDNSPV